MLTNPLPEITLTPNTVHDLGELTFYHSTDGQAGDRPVRISLELKDERLTVNFKCLNNPFSAHNSYTEHNSDLWRQEVFEVFIAAGDSTPSRYLELEINPNNALFAAWVENHSGQRPEKLTMLPYPDHGITHDVLVGDNHWSGSISIPLTLLGDPVSEQYRLNFYRIALHTAPTQPEWECDLNNCDFLCWSATMSGEQPAFHRPAYFGTLSVRS